MYLSSLCRSSSGHLLHYIKGFALISMPLHTSHGVCLCVHPYTLYYLCLCLHMLQWVSCINAWACVYPQILALVCLCLLMTDCVGPVCSYGTCLAIITLVHWGFQLNASGRWGEGLSGITRVTDQQGVPWAFTLIMTRHTKERQTGTLFTFA